MCCLLKFERSHYSNCGAYILDSTVPQAFHNLQDTQGYELTTLLMVDDLFIMYTQIRFY